jgi:plastocyanin
MTSHRPHLLTGALLVAALVIAGACNTPTSTPASAAASTAGGNAGNAVTISDFAFSPATITVAAGTKVTWTNQDSSPHTIVSDDGSTFKSERLANGASFSFTFTTAGTFAYHCGIHGSMTGKVIVTP